MNGGTMVVQVLILTSKYSIPVCEQMTTKIFKQSTVLVLLLVVEVFADPPPIRTPRSSLNTGRLYDMKFIVFRPLNIEHKGIVPIVRGVFRSIQAQKIPVLFFQDTQKKFRQQLAWCCKLSSQTVSDNS